MEDCCSPQTIESLTTLVNLSVDFYNYYPMKYFVKYYFLKINRTLNFSFKLQKEFSDDCIFNENMEEHHYNSYSSSFHSNSRRTMYLGLNRHGVIRKIQIPKLRSLGKLATYTKALTQNVVQDRVVALIAKLFGPNHIRHGIKQLCESGLALNELSAVNMKQKPKCNSAGSIGNVVKVTKKKKKKRKCRYDELDDSNLLNKTVISSAKLSNNSIINLSKPKQKKFQNNINIKTQPKSCIPNGDDQKPVQKKPLKKPNLNINKNNMRNTNKKKKFRPTPILTRTTPAQNLELVGDDEEVDLEHDDKLISSEEDEEWEELEKIGRLGVHNSFVNENLELEN